MDLMMLMIMGLFVVESIFILFIIGFCGMIPIKLIKAKLTKVPIMIMDSDDGRREFIVPEKRAGLFYVDKIKGYFKSTKGKVLQLENNIPSLWIDPYCSRPVAVGTIKMEDGVEDDVEVNEGLTASQFVQPGVDSSKSIDLQIEALANERASREEKTIQKYALLLIGLGALLVIGIVGKMWLDAGSGNTPQALKAVGDAVGSAAGVVTTTLAKRPPIR
jgi:hypothetical protein